MFSSLVISAALMGLAGGPHCLAMCGAACVGVTRAAPRAMWGFQIGRLLGYSSIGALAAASMQGLGWLTVQSAVFRPVWSFFHVLLMLLGLAYYYWRETMVVDRLLAGVITASAGMALSMGFKIAHSYSRDPVALGIAAASFLAMDLFHVHLIPLVLVAGPLAMAWYWPRRTAQP